MKKISFAIALVLSLVFVSAARAKTVNWKPAIPEGYQPISWAKAPGVATFIKAPSGNGSLDFLTRIYLPQNHVQFVTATSAPRATWGPGVLPFASDTVQDWAVPRMVAESAKVAYPSMTFLWNVPFFNITASTTDLSLALRSADVAGPYTTSGSRPPNDTANSRRMLVIDNVTGMATITDFDHVSFVSTTLGDQAVEGFAPTVLKSDGSVGGTARLVLGVTPDHKELVVYCSQGATLQEASDALTAAGVVPENQLEADGGGSATCAYNMPGQYFVEPSRTIPYLMGSFAVVARGTVTTEGLNVRTGPGTKYPAITKLSRGTPFEAYEEKNGWLKIGLDDRWVSAQLVKKSS